MEYICAHKTRSVVFPIDTQIQNAVIQFCIPHHIIASYFEVRSGYKYKQFPSIHVEKNPDCPGRHYFLVKYSVWFGNVLEKNFKKPDGSPCYFNAIV